MLEIFAHSIVTRSREICPHIAEPLQLWDQSARRAAKVMNDCVANIFESKIKTTATDAHQLVTPQVLEVWKPVYKQCGEASGEYESFGGILSLLTTFQCSCRERTFQEKQAGTHRVRE
jgi:hypothetical protein